MADTLSDKEKSALILIGIPKGSTDSADVVANPAFKLSVKRMFQ